MQRLVIYPCQLLLLPAASHTLGCYPQRRKRLRMPKMSSISSKCAKQCGTFEYINQKWNDHTFNTGSPDLHAQDAAVEQSLTFDDSERAAAAEAFLADAPFLPANLGFLACSSASVTSGATNKAHQTCIHTSFLKHFLEQQNPVCWSLSTTY